MIRLSLATALLVALALAPLPAFAQNPPPPTSTAPSPAEQSPLPTTTVPDPASKPGSGTAAPAPDKSLAPPLPAGAPPAASAAAPARPTLVPKPGEPNDVDEVTLPAKPAAILSGKTTWDDAVPNLSAAFQRIEALLGKAGIKPTGRPLAVFSKTEDDGFQFEAMIPVDAAPAQNPAESEGLRFGATPSGKALRFKHLGSYDEIDGTYETFTAYLEAKDITVQDRYIEEYVTDLAAGPEQKLDINIYAIPK